MDSTRRQSAGNPQLDWLAGLIDGEGSLMLAKHSTGTAFVMKPTVTIANTHKPTIERAAAIFKEHGLGVWICTNRPKSGKYPPQYSLFISGFKRVSRFLELMRERLFTKRPQAELLQEFVLLRDGGHPGLKYGQREQDIFMELKVCNNSRYRSWAGSSETLRVAPMLGEDKVQPCAKA